MNPLGMFSKRNDSLDRIQPISKIKPYPPVTNPPARPSFVSERKREEVDCEFSSQCKDYDNVAVAYCTTCSNNKKLKTKSFYSQIEGATL